MNNIAISGAAAADELLSALAEQLTSLSASYEIVVIGGSALVALGLVDRPTKDVDVIALSDGGTVRPARPLPPELKEARDRVARDFGLPKFWLNDGPADLVQFGLPEASLNAPSDGSTATP